MTYMARPMTPVWLLSEAERRQYTIIHEAAHAVIGHKLGVPIQRIHVGAGVHPTTGYTYLGYINHSSADDVLAAWQADPYMTHRTLREALHAIILLTMAAKEAEVIIIGRSTGGDGGDRALIEKYYDRLGLEGEERERWEARLRRQSRILVRRYRHQILFVWRQLMKRSIISHDDLATMLYRADANY